MVPAPCTSQMVVGEATRRCDSLRVSPHPYFKFTFPECLECFSTAHACGLEPAGSTLVDNSSSLLPLQCALQLLRRFRIVSGV